MRNILLLLSFFDFFNGLSTVKECLWILILLVFQDFITHFNIYVNELLCLRMK